MMFVSARSYIIFIIKFSQCFAWISLALQAGCTFFPFLKKEIDN